MNKIILTDEILLSNGWSYNDENAKYFPETWQGRAMLAKEDRGYRYVVVSDYDDEDVNSTPIVIEYVYQLQFLLMLLRKNTEIEL